MYMQTLIHEPGIGESIDIAAKKLLSMIVMLENPDDILQMDFNGIILQAQISDTPQSIVERYDQACRKRSEDYAASPEGIAAKAKREQDIRNKQAVIDAGMVELETIDFSNLEAVIDWFDKMADASDDTGVRVDGKRIIEIFTSHGFQINANTYDKFDGNDKANFAGYVVGQALDMLDHANSIDSGMTSNFIPKWRAKFEVRSNAR
jgi:hypothetical protein